MIIFSVYQSINKYILVLVSNPLFNNPYLSKLWIANIFYCISQFANGLLPLTMSGKAIDPNRGYFLILPLLSVLFLIFVLFCNYLTIKQSYILMKSNNKRSLNYKYYRLGIFVLAIAFIFFIPEWIFSSYLYYKVDVRGIKLRDENVLKRDGDMYNNMLNSTIHHITRNIMGIILIFLLIIFLVIIFKITYVLYKFNKYLRLKRFNEKKTKKLRKMWNLFCTGIICVGVLWAIIGGFKIISLFVPKLEMLDVPDNEYVLEKLKKGEYIYYEMFDVILYVGCISSVFVLVYVTPCQRIKS